MRIRKLVFIIAVMTVFALCIQTTVVCAESLSEIREKIEQKEAELEKGEKQEKFREHIFRKRSQKWENRSI